MGESITCGITYQFDWVKSCVDNLSEYHFLKRKNRANDPHGVFVKKGEMNEDELVEVLEGFRAGEETVGER
ncbi:MAG: hypothetical protein OCD01_19575 [Fibrobacterales bacterium]